MIYLLSRIGSLIEIGVIVWRLLRITVEEINFIRILSWVDWDQVLPGVANNELGLISSLNHLEFLEYLELTKLRENLDQIHFLIQFFNSFIIESIQLWTVWARAKTAPILHEIQIEDLQTLAATELDVPVLPDILLSPRRELSFKHSILSVPSLNFPVLFIFKQGAFFCLCQV